MLARLGLDLHLAIPPRRWPLAQLCHELMDQSVEMSLDNVCTPLAGEHHRCKRWDREEVLLQATGGGRARIGRAERVGHRRRPDPHLDGSLSTEATLALLGYLLNARLADAEFFYKQDLKKPLNERVEDLKGMIFLKEIGSYFDKAKRIEKLAGKIAA